VPFYGTTVARGQRFRLQPLTQPWPTTSLIQSRRHLVGYVGSIFARPRVDYRRQGHDVDPSYRNLSQGGVRGLCVDQGGCLIMCRLRSRWIFRSMCNMTCFPVRNRVCYVCALVAATLILPELAFAGKHGTPVSSQPECGK